MRPCIECGVPTDGSIGAAGIKWKMLCQNCKDLADRELAESIAAYAAAYDLVMPKVTKALNLVTIDHARPSPSTPEAA